MIPTGYMPLADASARCRRAFFPEAPEPPPRRPRTTTLQERMEALANDFGRLAHTFGQPAPGWVEAERGADDRLRRALSDAVVPAKIMSDSDGELYDVRPGIWRTPAGGKAFDTGQLAGNMVLIPEEALAAWLQPRPAVREERDPVAWFIREAETFRSKDTFIKLEEAYPLCNAATRCGIRGAKRAAEAARAQRKDLFRPQGGRDRT